MQSSYLLFVVWFRVSLNMITNVFLLTSAISSFLIYGANPNLATYLVLSFPHVNVGTSPESGNMALNTSSIPSFDWYDWWLVTVHSTQIAAALSVGIELQIVWRSDDDVVGCRFPTVTFMLTSLLAVERVEQKWAIRVCWQALAYSLCFPLCMCDSIDPHCPKLKYLQHTAQFAS